MRTLILIAVGLVIAAVVMHFTPSARRPLALGLFAAGWLGVCLLNLRTGLSHGYTLGQEAPIHALLYAVPAVFAWWLSRRGP